MAKVNVRNIARDASSVVIVAFAVALTLHWAQGSRSQDKPLHSGEAMPSVLTGSQLRVLVIAVSETCAYSQRSASFHRRAIGAAHDAGIPVVVALDKTGSGFSELKANLGPNDRVVQTKLRSSRITGTPTLILAERGKVSGLWTGLLASEQEDVLLSRMNGEWHTLSKIKGSRSEHGAVEKVVRLRASEIADKLSGSIILDTRSRAEYSTLPHRDGAINIPDDEISSRMQFDLPHHSSRIVIDCSATEESSCRANAMVLAAGGFGNVLVYDLGAEGASCETTPSVR